MSFTSYEISKQLYEAGFKAETNTLAHPTESIFGEQYPAYDLETLLNALPRTAQVGGREYYLRLEIDKDGIFASYRDKWCRSNSVFKRKRDNESLADSVALLFLDVKKSQAVLQMNLFYFLDTLPISTRLFNCIRNNMTPDSVVSDLILMGKSKIKSFANFANIGNKALAELEQLLAEQGLTLNN